MNATEKLSKMLNVIDNGMTLYITNYLHCWKINKKTVANFSKKGYDVLKVKNDEIYMLSGKNYVCITGCLIIAK